MKTSWSLPGALKVTLLLLVVITSLSHYSVFVTGSAQDICASIAANSPVNFFLIGRRSHSRLLITAHPDYLVYELPPDSLQNDTINMSSSGVVPVPLSNYFPTLYQHETFQKLIYGQNDSEAKMFTSGSVHSSATYLRMVSISNKLLFTFNMDTNESDVNTNITVPRPVQQFVSASDAENLNASFYSFYSDDGAKSFRMKYNLDSRKEMSPARQESTCKSTKGNITEMVLRKAKKSCSDAPSYDAWNWTESFKGWTENLIDGNATVRYYLFDGTAQRVMIFDLFDVHIAQNDFNSTVSYKAYKDFFVCPKIAKVTTTLILSTTSNQNHTASTKVSNLTTVTLVYNVTSNTNASMETSSEKSKFPLWIIIHIVVILLVVIIIIAAWYYYAGKKSSDSNKIASKEKLSNVKSTASSGKAASSVITSSKVLSTKVIPSKAVASKVKASSSQMVKDGNTKLAGPKVNTTKQQSKVVGQNSKVGGVGGKAKASGNISAAADTAKLKAKSSAASKASIRSSMVAPSKGPEAKVQKVQGLKAKK